MKKETVWGEREFIERLRARFPALCPGWDDGAVLPSLNKPVITIDSFFEGTHFHKWWQPPHILGRRLLEATLSDLAAMGATPGFVFISLCIPFGLELQWLEEFYSGLLSRNNLIIAGGETISGEKFGVTLTAIGEGGESLLTRDALREGDILWVSGEIGRACGIVELIARAGGFIGSALTPIKSELTEDELAQARAFLEPRAQFDLSEKLIEKGVSCAIDISDGLFSEAEHLAMESRADCEIIVDDVPFFSSVTDVPLKAAASGEDFVLLFGADAKLDFSNEGCTRVGRAESGTGKLKVVRNGRMIDIKEKGYNHLKG